MRPWMERATLRGRLHGRLLLVLVAIAVLASATAIWQFSTLLGDDEPSLGEIEGRKTLAAPDTTGEPDGPTASASATPSPTIESSPADDDTASDATEAGEPAATTEAAVSGPECTASLTLDNEWSSSISVTVTVANTGTDRVDGWEILLAFENLTVTTTWNLAHIEGDRYRDILLNGGIDPGGSVQPSFQADIEGEYALPATVPCTPAT